MIYHYEAEVLNYIHTHIPSVTQMTYASDDDLLEGLAKVKKFPTFYYSRKDLSITYANPYVIPPHAEGDTTVGYHKFFKVDFEYTGTFFVETQKQALELASKLKFIFTNNPIISASCPSISEPVTPPTDPPAYQKDINVQAKLIEVTTEDVRLPNNVNGSMRAVRATWHSTLFVNETPQTTPSLVEHVHLYTDLSGNTTYTFTSADVDPQGNPLYRIIPND